MNKRSIGIGSLALLGIVLPLGQVNADVVSDCYNAQRTKDIGQCVNTEIARCGTSSSCSIQLPAGIYDLRTKIWVDRNNVTLSGQGTGQTILRPPASFTGFPLEVGHAHAYPTEANSADNRNKALIGRIRRNNIEIRGFTIDLSQQCSSGSPAGFYDNVPEGAGKGPVCLWTAIESPGAGVLVWAVDSFRLSDVEVLDAPYHPFLLMGVRDFTLTRPRVTKMRFNQWGLGLPHRPDDSPLSAANGIHIGRPWLDVDCKTNSPLYPGLYDPTAYVSDIGRNSKIIDAVIDGGYGDGVPGRGGQAGIDIQNAGCAPTQVGGITIQGADIKNVGWVGIGIEAGDSGPDAYRRLDPDAVHDITIENSPARKTIIENAEGGLMFANDGDAPIYPAYSHVHVYDVEIKNSRKDAVTLLHFSDDVTLDRVSVHNWRTETKPLDTGVAAAVAIDGVGGQCLGSTRAYVGPSDPAIDFRCTTDADCQNRTDVTPGAVCTKHPKGVRINDLTAEFTDQPLTPTDIAGLRIYGSAEDIKVDGLSMTAPGNDKGVGIQIYCHEPGKGCQGISVKNFAVSGFGRHGVDVEGLVKDLDLEDGDILNNNRADAGGDGIYVYGKTIHKTPGAVAGITFKNLQITDTASVKADKLQHEGIHLIGFEESPIGDVTYDSVDVVGNAHLGVYKEGNVIGERLFNIRCDPNDNPSKQSWSFACDWPFAGVRANPKEGLAPLNARFKVACEDRSPPGAARIPGCGLYLNDEQFPRETFSVRDGWQDAQQAQPYEQAGRFSVRVKSLPTAGSQMARFRSVTAPAVIEASTQIDVMAVTTPLPTKLVAPSNLRATDTQSTQVTLSWQDNATDETGFQLERSPTGTPSSFSQIGGTLPPAPNTGSTVSYTDTGLTAGAIYYYQVKAKGTTPDQDSDYSTPALRVQTPGEVRPTSISALPDLVVDSVTSTPANPAANRSVLINAPVSNRGATMSPSAYTRARLSLSRLNANGSKTPLPVTTGTYTRVPQHDASYVASWTKSFASGTYELEVCADTPSLIAEADETNNCATQPLVVGAPPPAPGPDITPPQVSVRRNQPTPLAGGAVTITASASDDRSSIAKLELYVKGDLVATCEGRSSCAYTISNLQAETTYDYYAKATDGTGNSASSAVERFTVQRQGSTLPDLAVVISPVRITPPVNRGGNWSVLINAPVSNRGATMSPSAYTRARLSLSRLNANGSKTPLPVTTGTYTRVPQHDASYVASWTKSFASGTYELEVCADTPSLIAEADETNNCATQPLVVGAPQ